MTASLDDTRPLVPSAPDWKGDGLLLAGDIGGTKTALAVFSSARGPKTPLREAEYPSGKYPSLATMVREFLAGTDLPIAHACFDVAGPVIAGRAKTTNLPWLLAEDELAAEDLPPIIGEAALRRPDPDPLSQAALDLFVSILGAEAGNLAWTVLGTGGVFLASGIPIRILPALGDGRFMRAFVAKGRLGEMLARVPVHVVLGRAALLGAALRGLELAASPQLDRHAGQRPPR